MRAFLALRRFTRAFADPHLRLVPGKRGNATPATDGAAAADTAAAEEVDPPAGKDCGAAGYEEGEHAFRFPFASMAGWAPLQGDDFPTGLLGDVVRIAQFGEDQYAGACAQVFRAGMGEHALKLAVRELQQRRLVQAIRELQRRGARRLLVDVSGNGGGTEWVTEVVALLTDRALARAEPRLLAPPATAPRSGVVRQPRARCCNRAQGAPACRAPAHGPARC